MSQNRIIWLDALRGLLICLVVLGHSLQHGDFQNRLSWNIIYSFHMAAFFVVSGYVSYKREVKLQSIVHRAQQLLLPYFSWSFLSAIFEKGCDFSWMLTYIIQPDTSYWFIWVLFFISTIVLLIQSIAEKWGMPKDILLLVGGAILMLAVIFFNVKLFGFHFISYYFCFYVAGLLLKKYEIRLSCSIFVLVGVIWIILSVFWRQHDVPEIVKWISFLPSSITIYIYRLITAMLGSLFFYEFACRLMNKSSVLISLLSYFGRVSLGIYVIHLFFRAVVGDAYLNLFVSNTDIIFISIDFIVKLGVGVLGSYIISKNPLLSYYLLGKRFR